jgi:hypothetical protein
MGTCTVYMMQSGGQHLEWEILVSLTSSSVPFLLLLSLLLFPASHHLS